MPSCWSRLRGRPSPGGRAKGNPKMPKRPLAWFLLCFGVVALSGVVVVEAGRASGDYDHMWFAGSGTSLTLTSVFLLETVVLGIISAHGGIRPEWLAGYAGVVLGSVPIIALHRYDIATACGSGWSSCPPSPAVIDLLSQGVLGALIYAAPVAGVIFLVFGRLASVGRSTRNDLPTPPPVPPAV